MSSPSSQIGLFVTSVHRRARFVVAVESAAVALVSAVGITSLIAAALHAISPGQLITILVGSFFTTMPPLVLWQSPTRWAIMRRIDSTFSLSDVITSAALMNPVDPWTTAVSASAVHRVWGLKPAAAFGFRLGRRSWVGLGAAIVVFPITAAVVRPTAITGPVLADVAAVDTATKSPAGRSVDGLIRRPDAVTDSADASTAPQPAVPLSPRQQVVTDQTPQADAGQPPQSSSDAGRGAGSVRSATAPRLTRIESPPGTPRSMEGKTFSSGGATDAHPAGDGNDTTAGAGANNPGPTPVVSSPAAGTPRPRDVADRAITTKTIPPAARNLVRDYFQTNR